MALLVMIALAMLSLSTIELRSSRNTDAMQKAKANARMALMIALGELQKEMGPDMRVSVESAIFDANADTPDIDGVNQSHWLASYNAWGSWLNASYAVPAMDGTAGSPIKISDTYAAKRQPMFRRWLVSLPDNLAEDSDAAVGGGGLDDSNSVILVGSGTLGEGSQVKQHEITRAFRQKIGERGSLAWWIGPENHKAKITLSKSDQTLSTGESEVSQGNSPEVAAGVIDGMSDLESDAQLPLKMITHKSLRHAPISKDLVGEHFFDLTSHSWGVLANVRTGGLKKDLSLLLEGANMPDPYQFSQGDAREPSIRPMSLELSAHAPQIPNRHFASWTNMRHYYRMYRSQSDATAEGTEGKGSLNWSSGTQPWTNVACSLYGQSWTGSNSYWRMPVLAKLTFIYSLQSIEVPNTTPKRYNCYMVYSPIYTFWNPYNVELRIPDNSLKTLSLPYKILPLGYYSHLNGSQQGGLRPFYQTLKNDYGSHFRSGGGSDIIFKPGEIKIFSYQDNGTSTAKQTQFLPGFDPQAIGGDKVLVHGSALRTERPGMAISFANPGGSGGNVWFGNTPGSLNNPFSWNTIGNWMPTMYPHDWFQKAQYDTRITPEGSADVGEWQFADNEPVPFAYTQFVIKTSSEFDYESINWADDWRSRNWLQAPPCYFGSAMYISQDSKIAHTQRLDNPYMMNFGPMSSADMPKVVPHIGDNAFLGSGAAPHEKVTSVALLELPTAPLSSLAGFSNMRINPGWSKVEPYTGAWAWDSQASPELKGYNYQSGVTGPGIGNSFIHPMLPRTDVYRFFDNSKSQDVSSWSNASTTERDNKMYCDYWDHVLLLNDALWDGYFVSSLADQSRPSSGATMTLSENLDKAIADGEVPAISRYRFLDRSLTSDKIKTDLSAEDGYLKSAKHIMVDGMFNVNSTSVDAWHALFSGIRARSLVARDGAGLKKIDIPSGKAIALSKFNTAISDKESPDPENGVTLANGQTAWTGVRFLDDDQLRKLAEECVVQVKKRGPFLNYSEFINRRLSNDDLGLMGALQSAIDYDDATPDAGSINYRFKSGPDYMLKPNQLGDHDYKTPEAATGSRFAGIPGYVTQSDILKPIGNTLSVRDDTYRIRTYGEVRDTKGTVIAQAWCEAIVQRVPDYCDPANEPEESPRTLDAQGVFTDNASLTEVNRKFGRKFKVQSFRWLNKNEI